MTAPTETPDRLVDRRLVHRRAHAEVLLTGIEPAGGPAWRAGLQIHRAHPHIGPERHVPDTLAVEAVRQVGVALAQLHADAGPDAALTLQHAWLEWPRGPVPVPDVAPLDLTARVEITAEPQRRGVRSGLTVVAEFCRGTEVAWRAGGDLSILARRHYRALRRHAAGPDRVPPRYDRTILLPAPDPDRHLLGYDLGDGLVFDHVPDHLPGMLLVQAMDHLRRRHVPHRPHRGLSLRFAAFAEYLPLVEVTWRAGTERTAVEFRQEGTLVASGALHHRAAPAPAEPVSDLPSASGTLYGPGGFA